MFDWTGCFCRISIIMDVVGFEVGNSLLLVLDMVCFGVEMVGKEFVLNWIFE